jgi:hypothetical protein
MIDVVELLELLADHLSVPDNVDQSLPPLPANPWDRDMERARRWRDQQQREAERERLNDADRRMNNPTPWERLQDAYRRTGDNMIDRARDWIADDIRRVRDAEADKAFQRRVREEADQKYPHGFSHEESTATASHATSGSGTTSDSATSRQSSGSGGGTGAGRGEVSPTESPSLNFSEQATEGGGRPDSGSQPDSGTTSDSGTKPGSETKKPTSEDDRDRDHKGEIDVLS